MDAIGGLRCLVERGFRGVPVRDAAGELDALLYVRQWPSGVVDVVLVHSPAEAVAYRAGGIGADPSWYRAGRPEAVASAVLGLG